MKVGIVYDPVHSKHDPGAHVEISDRLEKVISSLKQTRLLSRLTPIASRPATIRELSRVHFPEHIQFIQSIASKGGGAIDPDTILSSGSFEAALYAAGGTIRAMEEVLDGSVDYAFALVRPPGHHATPHQAMGFCLFNNVSIAASHALSRYGLERLAIIDFDVHHGNGTQEVFYYNPQVLYVSVHQDPLFPGTGHIEETGFGQAAGTKVNIPLPPGCGDAEYQTAFEKIVIPVVERFQPQLILVSAGFDLHWADDISSMYLSTTGIVNLVKILKTLADRVCQNRLAIVLEGGYHQTALTNSIKATFEMLLDNDFSPDLLGPSPHAVIPPLIIPLIQYIRKIHSLA